MELAEGFDHHCMRAERGTVPVRSMVFHKEFGTAGWMADRVVSSGRRARSNG
jgi:hypothetical protein